MGLMASVGSFPRRLLTMIALFAGALLIVPDRTTGPISPAARAQGAELRQVQEMLIWTGHYDGLIDGKGGSRTTKAIKDFQLGLGYSATGILTNEEALILKRQGGERKNALGFTVVRDAYSGIMIGIPLQLAANKTSTAWGANWAGQKISIDALRFAGSRTIRQLFDRLTSVSGRTISYSLFRDSWFVVTGVDADGRVIYARAETRGDEVRAFTATYDKRWLDDLRAVVVAMASSFDAFPSGGDAAPGRLDEPGPDCWRGLGEACPRIFSLGRSAGDR